jgi:small GTP-binding protein
MSASTADLPVLPPKKAKKPRVVETKFVVWDTAGKTKEEIDGEAEQSCVIVTFGNSGVGKTSLLKRFGLRQFNPKSTTTIGIDYIGISIMFGGKKTRLSMWDTAGQERYASITNQYLRKAELVFLAFDMSKPQTLLNLAAVRQEVADGAPACICALFGLKADLGVGSWYELPETRATIKALNCVGGVYVVSNTDQAQVDKAVLSAVGIYFGIVKSRKLRESEKMAAYAQAQQEVKLAEIKEKQTGCCG